MRLCADPAWGAADPALLAGVWPQAVAALHGLSTAGQVGQDGLALVLSLAALASLPAQVHPVLVRVHHLLSSQLPSVLQRLSSELGVAAQRAQQLIAEHTSKAGSPRGDGGGDEGGSQGSAVCESGAWFQQLRTLGHLNEAAGQLLAAGQAACQQAEELVETLDSAAAHAHLQRERHHLASLQATSAQAALKAQLQVALATTHQQLQVRGTWEGGQDRG